MCARSCMDLSMYVFVYNTCRYIYICVCMCAHVRMCIAAIGTSVRVPLFLVSLVTYTHMHTDSQLDYRNPSPTCGVVSLASLYSGPPKYRLASETTFAYHEME